MVVAGFRCRLWRKAERVNRPESKKPSSGTHETGDPFGSIIQNSFEQIEHSLAIPEAENERFGKESLRREVELYEGRPLCRKQ